MTLSPYARLDDWVDANFGEETEFLQALVRVPTDTPPGNNAPHAERTAALLAGFGFIADRYPVPDAVVREYGLESITNLVVRRRYGEGHTIALNAHGDVVPPGEGWVHANCYDESRQVCVKCEKQTGAFSSAEQGASASAMACPNCQTPSQGGRFCHECGFDMASTHKSCPSCGVTMPRQARFCTDCGHGF
jgi:hypothetical protein